MPQQISFGDEYVTVPTPGRSPVLPYSVRVSSRARRVRLVMSPREGLVVVVPRWFRKSSVAEILEEKREWIARMHEQHREQRKIRPSALDAPLPRQIRLSAAQRTWQVRYKSEAADTVRVHEQNGVLTLHGAVWDVALCHEALRRWLHRTAKRVFANMLDRVSEETGLRYKSLVVRNQKARWGSCSRHRIISLNQKAMFLPPSLVRYLCIHELCHTRHMNHSPRFWGLVEEFDPRYESHDQALQDAWIRYVPSWAEPSS